MDKELYTDPGISNAELINRDTFERLKARKKHKRVFRTISYILISLVLGLIFVAICMAVFLKIEAIEVKGNIRYTREEIVQASGISVGQNLYAIDKKAARAYITADHPYINEVVIRRNLPSTLVFNVSEEKSKYYTEICGEYFVLSESLRVLERRDSIPTVQEGEDPLVLLLLSEVKSAVVGEELEFTKDVTFEYINDFMQNLNNNTMTKDLTEIDMSEKYNIYVNYKGRFRIYIGDNTETEMKLKFAKLMIDTFDENKRGQIDAHDITVGSVILEN